MTYSLIVKLEIALKLDRPHLLFQAVYHQEGHGACGQLGVKYSDKVNISTYKIFWVELLPLILLSRQNI